MTPTTHENHIRPPENGTSSQMTLPEQLESATTVAGSQSLNFLPATTYSGLGKVAKDLDRQYATPDAFYQQYSNHYGASKGASLRQGAIRKLDVNADENAKHKYPTVDTHVVYRNGVSIHDLEDVRPHMSSPGLRARKNSVKNLVDQYNASSSDDLPPVPNNAPSNIRNGIQGNGPSVPTQNDLQQPNPPRSLYGLSHAAIPTRHGSNKKSGSAGNSVGRSALSPAYGSSEMIAQNRRPLFGEILSTPSNLPAPGYGIQGNRQRSGSEGSPLPSPNLIGPQTAENASRSYYNAITSADSNLTLSPNVYSPSNHHSHHRRANSESPLTPTRLTAEVNHHDLSVPPAQHKGRGESSRIPVSVRRTSASADVKPRPSNASLHDKPVPDLPYAEQQRRSPRRKIQSPQNPRSPAQRTRAINITPGPKSPSLRANIIIPPPKISPPLRSSRPRLPVSSASTAASRAKVAEKLTTLQRMSDDKISATRRAIRPPELSDIDLKARRLRITQALSRSLEGQDLKGSRPPCKSRDTSTSRTASPARSTFSEFNETRNAVPAVIVDQPVPFPRISDEDTPFAGVQRQERAFSHNALDAMQGNAHKLVGRNDSPTLGPGLHYLDRLMPLRTGMQRQDDTNEPSSAFSDGTTIDLQPQDQLRDTIYETVSDRADQESVQLVLRDTIHLDDEEAIRKGYRSPAMYSSSVPNLTERNLQQRKSWASSLGSDHEVNSDLVRSTEKVALGSTAWKPQPAGATKTPAYTEVQSSVRSTMASDAYTIVNIVLQQHSASGIVDQQFVDDIYQRILEDSPFDNASNLSADRIEQICLQEIQEREEFWSEPDGGIQTPIEGQSQGEGNDETPKDDSNLVNGGGEVKRDWLPHQSTSSGLVPPPFTKRHRHESSLGSAADWLDASPSISDWIRYAADEGTPKSGISAPISHVDLAENENPLNPNHANDSQQAPTDAVQDDKEDPDLYSAPRPKGPAPRPPSLPTEENSFGTATIQRPQIPRRITSVSQIGRSSPRGRQSPVVSAPILGKVSSEEVVTPQQRRLRQRRNVIKELVDTEFSYEKDLRVLCDIYKLTASAALGEEDIKVLFGNVEEVQTFSEDFLMLLKSLAKPTYVMERQDAKREVNGETTDKSDRPHSSASTQTPSKSGDVEPPTLEKDSETRIGEAFGDSLAEMEKVYTEYIKNRQAANLRLDVIQKSHGVREWLKECKENSSDITNAWNLDALLVKPVQRITKYPLLLKELVDATSEDHPDLPFLRRALHDITEVNIRINDVKKHAELVDQVLNRKRKDSDVRAGFSKAFGRRAEKLKQHVGMTELYEDAKYNEIKIHYDNNIVQLMVVGNDCSSYGRAISKWVDRMVQIAAAAEAWVDVGHSHHQEAESKLRQFAMVIRGISTIALPDHIEQLNSRVLGPMQQAVDMMTKFKTDPKGLLQKREKRMIDYAQIKSKKDRGEKLDRKSIERMEQSEALNIEAKQRMRKLVSATAKLVQACQGSLIQMQTSWQSMVRQKLSAAMSISLDHLTPDDILKDWQVDFDYQEASALTLGICNGSLLAEAVNMMSFQGSSTTLNGDESPRQASFTTASKRSVSLASEQSYLPIPEYDPRTSGLYGHQYHEHSMPYANPRARAQSAASARYARTPDLSQHGSAHEGVPSYTRQDNPLPAPPVPVSIPVPRLSVETPSPLNAAMLQQEFSTRRPTSSSTFFSASGTPPPPPSQPHLSTGSSIFSSAMPMSDSPIAERFSEITSSADPQVLFTAASVYEFNIDRSRREAGFPYLTYVTGEIFDIIGERGELWLARNQDDPQKQIGWIWNKHFAKLAE